MNKIFIYQHLGMGDHILCNAIIREYTQKYDKIFLFVKPNNIKNVFYMYRDLGNKIQFFAMTDPEVHSYMNLNKNENFLIIGHTNEYFQKLNNGIYETFDTGFYEMAQIPIKNKWDKFYIQQDINLEKETFYNKLKLQDNEEYLFVHDDQERGRYFKNELINKGIKIIRPTDHKDIQLFDFIYTIKKAKEVHVMNSSFSCLIDTMQINNNNLYFHEYARTDMGNNPNHKLKLNWNILK